MSPMFLFIMDAVTIAAAALKTDTDPCGTPVVTVTVQDSDLREALDLMVYPPLSLLLCESQMLVDTAYACSPSDFTVPLHFVAWMAKLICWISSLVAEAVLEDGDADDGGCGTGLELGDGVGDGTEGVEDGTTVVVHTVEPAFESVPWLQLWHLSLEVAPTVAE